MKSLRRIALAAVAVFAVFSVGMTSAGCSSLEDTSTCGAVCARYGECFDDELNVDQCTGKCLEGADRRSETFLRDVDRCEKCMDMEGCREAAFDCFDECGQIIGQSALS
jgi:hypothetical protein